MQVFHFLLAVGAEVSYDAFRSEIAALGASWAAGFHAGGF